MGADGGGDEMGFAAFEVVEGLGEGFDGGVGEEEAGFGGDGFQGAAAGEGDDGAAAGLGFEGGEAEVFFAGEEEGAAVLVVGADDVVGLAAEETDVGGIFGEGVEAGGFGAVADDDEGAVGGGGEGADGEVDFLDRKSVV